MDFDWIDTTFDIRSLTPREIEESFEDPFSLRMLPESESSERNARYICLGRTISNRAVFSVFWTDGKSFRVICARDMCPEEVTFYERKNAENF